jgi:hypothetical protein
VSTAAELPPASLPDDVRAFIQSGISITVASRDERLVPSIAKAVGCRVADDGREISVMMFSDAAETVARDIARSGQVAVVFTRPSTNRTMQLKGRDVRAIPVQPADVALARRWLLLFTDELQGLGWDPEFVASVFWHDPAQLIAFRFTAESAFHQTPGPGAGAAMDLKGGGRR